MDEFLQIARFMYEVHFGLQGQGSYTAVLAFAADHAEHLNLPV